MRILVVDDDDLVRELTVAVLERAGYDVVSAADASEALVLAANSAIDLVVSDVVMPGLTGVDLLTELQRRTPDLPVILMTGGSPDPERTAMAPELGAHAIVFKPYTHAELRNAVAAALSGQPRSRSPAGSERGSTTTSAATQLPKISTSRPVPGALAEAGRYAYAIERSTV